MRKILYNYYQKGTETRGQRKSDKLSYIVSSRLCHFLDVSLPHCEEKCLNGGTGKGSCWSGADT